MIPKEQIKENVKKGYAVVAEHSNRRNFLSTNFSCCNPNVLVDRVSKKIGYTEKELENTPAEANLGLGCGNPTAFASIKKGETILDLGSGAGFDCFIAANETGKSGKVIGVDLTPEMIEKAKLNAQKGNYTNVEFINGDIEALPISDNSVDLVISNCVINLTTNKEQVFREIFRVLKPEGRMMISDIILLRKLPEIVSESFEGYIACLAGAVNKIIYINAINDAGFENLQVEKETTFPIELLLTDPIAAGLINMNHLTSEQVQDISNSIASIAIKAFKP